MRNYRIKEDFRRFLEVIMHSRDMDSISVHNKPDGLHGFFVGTDAISPTRRMMRRMKQFMDRDEIGCITVIWKHGEFMNIVLGEME